MTGCQKKMNVVCHQYVRMHCDALLRSGFLQPVKISPTIAIVEETRRSIVAANDDVLRHAGDVESRLSRHDRMTGRGLNVDISGPRI